jgi:uncharacterized protein GlcG (DUF336 family)
MVPVFVHVPAPVNYFRESTMRIATIACIATFCLALTDAGRLHAQAQQQPAAARITLEDAKKAVDAAEAEARKNNWNLVFVITDSQGAPIYLRRMDGVPTRNYEIAMAKTKTSITSGMHTVDYAAAVRGGRMTAIEGGTTFEGGYLLKRGGQLVGAFSASGARGSEDAQAVRAGMAAIGIQP